MNPILQKSMRSLAALAASAVAITAWLAVTPAQAADPIPGIDPTAIQVPPTRTVLDRYDLDHDGKLSLAEKAAFRRDMQQKVAPMRQQALRQYDWDGNGKLEGNELEAMRGARATQHARAEERALKNYDANHDGVLDAAEQQARRAAREAWLSGKQAQTLRVYDANRNGVLDPAEKAAIRTRAQDARQRALDMYDANGDGRIDAEERHVALQPGTIERGVDPARLSGRVAAAAGGTVQSDGGSAKLAIPPGALSADARVILRNNGVAGETFEAGRRVLGSWTLEVSGGALQQPAMIDLSFAPAAATVSHAQLAIGRWTGEGWEEVGGTVSAPTRRVSAAVTRPGRYAVLERAGASSGPATVAGLRLVPASGRDYRDGVDVRFSLGGAGGVSVKVYDTAGRLVRTVAARQSLPAGPQALRWDGRGTDGRTMANGLYLVSVEGPLNRLTSKVAFIR